MMRVLRALAGRPRAPQLRLHAWALLLLLAPAMGLAQTVSFSLSSGSAAPGGTVSLNVSLNSTAGSEPAGVEWALNYSSTDFTAVQITDGAAATAAGKSSSCAASVGSVLCLTTGINSNAIANGVFAIATFTISPTTSSSSSSIQIANAVAASLSGSGVPTSASGGAVTIL